MTLEQRISELEQEISTLKARASAETTPSGYYVSQYSGEEQDTMFAWVKSQMNPGV